MERHISRARTVEHWEDAERPRGKAPDAVISRMEEHVIVDRYFHVRRHVIEDEPRAADPRTESYVERAGLDRERRLDLAEQRSSRWFGRGFLAGMGFAMALVGFVSHLIH